MSESYYVGAYWLARKESAGDCALRAESLFRRLGRCDPAWARWCEPADSFEEASQLQVNTDAASFTRLFGKKAHQQLGGGFHFWLWSGDNPEQTTSVHARCGSPSSRIPSVCVLDPPSAGAVAERVLTATVMTEVLRAMALAWEPEWAVATSDKHRDLLTQGSDPDTFTGWGMYFSHQRGLLPPLPAPVRVETVEDKGTLVILTPERFSASNPEHVALAARVQEILEHAGLLGALRHHAQG